MELPNSITRIDYGAFSNCIELNDITIPANVSQIDEAVFSGCSKLINLKVDKNNQTFCNEDGVVYDKDKKRIIFCSKEKMGSMNIPDSVERIDNYAFEDCTKLTSIKLSSSFVASVSSDLQDRFLGCSKLNSIEVDDRNDNYSAIDGVVYNKNKTELIYCPEGKKGTVTIPNSVEAIRYKAFYNCKELTTIKIPKSLKNLDWYAIQGCTKLIQIDVDKENKNYCSENGVVFNKDKTKLVRCLERKRR